MSKLRDSNLLKEYGLSANLEKPFSISFIDNFLDCSYKTFLTYFAKCGSQVLRAPTEFGKAMHNALNVGNTQLREKKQACLTCDFKCKMGTERQKCAVDMSEDECPMKKAMMDKFRESFNDKIQTSLIDQAKDQKRVKGEVQKYLKLAPRMMSQAMFEHTPVNAQVVLSEAKLNGTLGGFKLSGIVDILYKEGEAAIVADYKTRSTKPSPGSFPLRQMSVYTRLLRAQKVPVLGIRAIYMIKTGEVVTQNYDLVKNNEQYENSLADLQEEMGMIRTCLSNGTFLRNRGSMYCPCELSAYCFNNKKLEKHLRGEETPEEAAESINTEEESPKEEAKASKGIYIFKSEDK